MPKHPALPTITALSEHSVDRRRILKAAAWSLPVIAVAVAAPAATASGEIAPRGGGPLLTLTGTCDFGKKGPGFILTVQGAPLLTGSTILIADATASGNSWNIASLTGATILAGRKGTFAIALGADLAPGTYRFGPKNNANVCEYTATLQPSGTYNPSSKLTGTVDPQHNKHDDTCVAS